MMIRNRMREDKHLLDAEAWDTPGRLSDEDLHGLNLNARDEPGWRSALGLFDPEDAR